VERDDRRASFAGSVVRLPADAGPPFQVFVNGVLQEPRRDYDVRDDRLVFRERLIQPEHTVDVVYRAGGETRMAHGLTVEPPAG
jgi:hypothetical protein